MSASEESDCDKMPPLENASDLEYNMEQQRKKIFHTRCLINDSVCSMIIDIVVVLMLLVLLWLESWD